MNIVMDVEMQGKNLVKSWSSTYYEQIWLQ